MTKLTPSAYWFMINSSYFAFASNEFLDKKEPIKKILLKILDKFSNANYAKNVNLHKEKIKKKQFLLDLCSFVDRSIIKKNEEDKYFVDNFFDKKNISTDFLVDLLEENLKKISEKNEDNLTDFLPNSLNNRNKSLNITNFSGRILTDGSSENQENCKEINQLQNSKIDKDDILMDLRFKSKHSKDFEDYIIHKNEEMNEKKKEIILSRSDEEKYNNPDDIVCLVCNDGDYEDNDLIVYCSKCQMTVHQNCYGITNIPEEDWLCDPCKAFEDERSKEIECILCPIKGGAMKPSLLKCKSSFCNSIVNIRKENPNYKNSNLIGLTVSNDLHKSSSLERLNFSNNKNDLGKFIFLIKYLYIKVFKLLILNFPFPLLIILF